MKTFERASTATAFSQLMGLLAAGGIGGNLQIWEAWSGRAVTDFVADEDFMGKNGFPFLNEVTFSPDGSRLATVGAVGRTEIWDTRDWRLISSVFLPEASRLVFSPNGRMIAAATSMTGPAPGEVSIVDTETSRVMTSFGVGASGLAFGPDGTTLAVAEGEDKVLIVDLKTGTTLASFQMAVGRTPYYGGVSVSLEFTPDGRVLCVGGSAGSVELRAVDDGRLLARLDASEARITALAFNADGSVLASGGEDGAIRLWGLARH